jgi:hypothetical protein
MDINDAANVVIIGLSGFLSAMFPGVLDSLEVEKRKLAVKLMEQVPLDEEN